MGHPAPSRARTLLAVLLAAGMVAVAAVSLGSLPAVCGGCHVMRPYADALDESAHASVGCYDCHLSSGWDWARFKTIEVASMYPAFLSGADMPQGPSPGVSDAPCLACHRDVMRGVREASGLRIRHDVCTTAGDPCYACHQTSAHGRTARWERGYVMEECVSCHLERDAPGECDACHEGHLEAERLEKGPWQITHGATWRSTHGMGAIRYCRTCHPDDYCARCHGLSLPHPADFGTTHGAAAVEEDARCEECHDTARLCDECHGIEMPHPAGFLPDHSSIARDRFDEECLVCHDVRDCNDCHVRHTHPGTTEGDLGAGGGESG